MLFKEEEDLGNQNIEMYSTDTSRHSSISNQNLNSINSNEQISTSSTDNSIIGNIRNFVKSKMSNKNSNDSIFSSSLEQQNNDSCKDRLKNKLIKSIEVERNLTLFISFILIGSFLLCISLFLLPLIITSPSKFSFAFSFGSIFILISFLFLKGTKAYFEKLFENKRFWISVSYICSVIIGICFSLGRHYFISLICSAVQLISMVMFILSFIPGCQCGINFIKNKLSSPFTKVFVGVAEQKISNLK